MRQVIVAGGGIAGTATALALHKAGIPVAVYEAHPDSGDDIGAFLSLAHNGMRALAELDAAELVAAAGFGLTGTRLITGDGSEIVAAPLNDHDHRCRSGVPTARC